MGDGKVGKVSEKAKQIAGNALGLLSDLSGLSGLSGLILTTLYVIGITFLGWGWDLLFCACIWFSSLQRATRWGK